MKTFRLFPTVLLGLVAPLALSAGPAPKPPARTEVIFVNPEKFTDVKDSDFATDKGRDDILDRLRTFIVDRAEVVLPAGQKLTITFTDIDLAGEFEPWRGAQFGDVRIVKAIYPPAFKFSYQVADEAGQKVKSGEENIRDMAFDMRMTFDRQDSLHYEKDILGDWIRGTLRAPKK